MRKLSAPIGRLWSFNDFDSSWNRKVDSLEKNSTKERLDSDSRASSSGSIDKTDNVIAHQSMNNTNHPPLSPPAYGVNNGGVRYLMQFLVCILGKHNIIQCLRECAASLVFSSNKDLGSWIKTCATVTVYICNFCCSSLIHNSSTRSHPSKGENRTFNGNRNWERVFVLSFSTYIIFINL